MRTKSKKRRREAEQRKKISKLENLLLDSHPFDYNPCGEIYLGPAQKCTLRQLVTPSPLYFRRGYYEYPQSEQRLKQNYIFPNGPTKAKAETIYQHLQEQDREASGQNQDGGLAQSS